jgi:hypothetical protein
MTEDLPRYIAAGIAESRVKKVRESLRDKLLQLAQLEDGRLVDMADGVVSDLVVCPACLGEGPIEVPAPFGVEAGEMSLPSFVDIAALSDDVTLWGIKQGVLKLSLDTKQFDQFAHTIGAEEAFMVGTIARALKPRTTAVLRVIAPAKLASER